MPYWEHFSHDADIGIRGIGNTPEEAFEMAALSFTSVTTDLHCIASSNETVKIHCESSDIELLFYDWINALVYETDTQKILFNKFNVHIANGLLNAECFGEKIIREIHRPAVEVKGATMTELKVYRNEQNLWVAQCIVDV